MLSKIEITIDLNGPGGQTLLFNTQRQNGESFSKLFPLSLLTTCTIIYVIQPSEYSNLNNSVKMVLFV